VIENGMNNPIPMSSHQRTLSSPCQLVLNEGGFTSEDEPELLELTSLSSLSRSTAQLLNSESTNTNIFPVTRLGSTKRSRVNIRILFILLSFSWKLIIKKKMLLILSFVWNVTLFSRFNTM
jgi:hypothetical protein